MYLITYLPTDSEQTVCLALASFPLVTPSWTAWNPKTKPLGIIGIVFYTKDANAVTRPKSCVVY